MKNIGISQIGSVFQLSKPEKFYDLLFEISNEYRHQILLLLARKPLRVTDISKKLDLTSQEISRHVARLGDIGLTHKDVEGLHHLSHLGGLVIQLLEEIEFTSQHSEYLLKHALTHLPDKLVKRVGDLKDSTYIHRLMDFLQLIDRVIREAEDHVWFMVDQYPLNALDIIKEALDRGVEFRTIEPERTTYGPHFDLQDSEDMMDLRRARTTPLVQQRTLESIDSLVFISDKIALFAFPTLDGDFDYRGFTTVDEGALEWCRELFEHYWKKANPKVYLSPTETLPPPQKEVIEEGDHERIVLRGQDDSRVDAQAVQDAVDNYDEVVLEGTFNFGINSVTINRSVIVRGEGRDGDIPTTEIYKDGWTFPSPILAQVFLVQGDDVEAVIENIHFTDFNAYCIRATEAQKITVRNNRITLETGLYRGIQNIAFGDAIIAVLVHDGFPGGVVIEGNYIDFALDPLYGGQVMLWAMDDPYYRPNPVEHEYYSGYGIYVRDVLSDVVLAGNTIHNMSARAISASVNNDSKIVVKDNTIVSEVYGSYVIDKRWAGIGIVIHPSLHIKVDQAGRAEIKNNVVEYDKPNFAGIMITGTNLSPDGTEKLADGVVRSNSIHLAEGAAGIIAESCDRFNIIGNTISGCAYYGIGVFPRGDAKRTSQGAYENVIEDNDMREMKLRSADENSRGLFDDRAFKGTKAGTAPAHLWLNTNTRGSLVKVKHGETVVDEGEANTVLTEENKA